MTSHIQVRNLKKILTLQQLIYNSAIVHLILNNYPKPGLLSFPSFAEINISSKTINGNYAIKF